MHQRAVLAGGCFWGMQDLIRKLPGVVSTRVGILAATLRTRPTATMVLMRRGSKSSSIQRRRAASLSLLFASVQGPWLNVQKS